jgi:hypothetical protein
VGLEEKRLGIMGQAAQRMATRQEQISEMNLAAQQAKEQAEREQAEVEKEQETTGMTGAEIAASMGGGTTGGDLLPASVVSGLKEQYAGMTGGGVAAASGAAKPAGTPSGATYKQSDTARGGVSTIQLSDGRLFKISNGMVTDVWLSQRTTGKPTGWYPVGYPKSVAEYFG